MRKLMGIVAGLLVLVGGLVLATGARAGQTITVSSTADVSPNPSNCIGSAAATSCTLRDAVDYANNNAGTTITVPADTYLLSGALTITAPVTINGAGSATTLVEQTAAGQRVLTIASSAGATAISGLELTGGTSTEGAGIYIDPSVTGVSVTLTGDLIDKNHATGTAGLVNGGNGGAGNGGGIALQTSSEPTNLTLSGTTVTANTAAGGLGAAAGTGSGGGSGGEGVGAGIYFNSEGTLTIGQNSAVTSNVTTGGAGGSAPSGKSVGNGGFAEAGGIELSPSASVSAPGTFTLTDATVSGNSATGGPGTNAPVSTQANGMAGSAQGGGIADDGLSPVTLTGLTADGNKATGGTQATVGSSTPLEGASEGGGIIFDGPVTIAQSLLEGNSVAAPAGSYGSSGGAISETTGPLTLVNSTVYANTAQATGTGVLARGGGVETAIDGTSALTATLASDTLDQNVATAAAAGDEEGANLDISAPTQIASTVVADPQPSGAPNCYVNHSGDVSDGNNNLEDDAADSCDFLPHKDVIGKSPAFGTLAANGGPTDTVVPGPGSPAIGAGGACVNPAVSGSPALTVDQRGFARPSGGPCDVGAVQIQGPANTAAPTVAPTSTLVGGQVNCSPGTWTGDGSIAYTYAWLRNGTQVATGATYATASADIGQTLVCAVTGTTSYGASATAQSAAVTVTAPKPATTTTTPGTTSVTLPTSTSTTPSKTPTRITVAKAALTHKSFRESGKAAKGKPPVGTAFHFTLSAKVTVHIAIRHTVKGVVVKKKCVAKTAKLKGRACTLTVTNGTLTVHGKKGANTLTFAGKVGSKHLAVGRYTAVISVVEPKGAKASSETVSFTIVK